jgi:hypothetical protein
VRQTKAEEHDVVDVAEMAQRLAGKAARAKQATA